MRKYYFPRIYCDTIVILKSKIKEIKERGKSMRMLD